jgi:hypothetical protein
MGFGDVIYRDGNGETNNNVNDVDNIFLMVVETMINHW